MHRYREFGLVSEEDEVLRRAFRDGFKRAGLSFAQFIDALAWYRDHARPASDEAQLADAFAQFAAEKGWPTQQRDGVLDVYRAIRDNGPEAVMQPRPADEDRAVLAHADELLRSDPARYWGDVELQDAAFEAHERLNGVPSAPGSARPSEEISRDQRRVEEIECLLRDPTGEGQRRYWTDAELRADYGQALARLHGEGEGSNGESAVVSSPVAGEMHTAPAMA